MPHPGIQDILYRRILLGAEMASINMDREWLGSGSLRY